LNGSAVCRRCKAELDSAWAIENKALFLEGRAMLFIAQGKPESALPLLKYADFLLSKTERKELSSIASEKILERSVASTGDDAKPESDASFSPDSKTCEPQQEHQNMPFFQAFWNFFSL
jgi:hypothetical protein